MIRKIIFDDELNKLRIVDENFDLTNYVDMDLVFHSDETCNEFIKLINSLYLACDMRDKKMFIRIFNRLLEFSIAF